MEGGRGIPTSWGNNKAPNNLSPPRFLFIGLVWSKAAPCYFILLIPVTMVWFNQKMSHHSLFWTLFLFRFDQWHSSPLLLSLAFHFIHLGCEYLAYIFHMQLVDGSSPEQEHADKFSNVSSYPGPLVSPDTTYEVNFTLSSLISAPISRCLHPIQRSSWDP